MPACTFNIINFGEMNKKHFNSTFIRCDYNIKDRTANDGEDVENCNLIHCWWEYIHYSHSGQ